MQKLIGNVQEKIKTTSNAFALMLGRLLSGLFVALTLSLIFQEIVGYGWISFLLVITVVTVTLMRLSRGWTWTHLLIFNLICVLIGLLLRMYILIGPGV